jgi:ribose 5-phosphate isomerase B
MTTDPTSLPIAVASDHAGVGLRLEIRAHLERAGHVVLDLGTDGAESVDYPDFADAMAAAIRDGRAERGVLICGSGIGISMAANRHRSIRAALCHDATTSRLARLHNDANVLALGARVIGADVAKDCVDAFFATAFEGGRHMRRVAKLG